MISFQKTWMGRLAVLAAAAATAMVVSTSPAAAYTNITISDEHGKMTFIDSGDVFEVCDTKADGHGVRGELWYDPPGGDWYVSQWEEDGGDAGCDKFGSDVGPVGSYKMKLKWMGVVVAESRTFNE